MNRHGNHSKYPNNALLVLAASDLSYKQIASHTKLSYNTICNRFERLFRKYNVQTRLGLLLKTGHLVPAIPNIIQLNPNRAVKAAIAHA